ncbi:hypothetical protein JOE63_002596 [Cellulosimicrobium cellulans]|uniref:hypothetical protein n=1 Tax=Cellulosimicrobium cellulans TaxID=1710 RepID=UPI001959DF2F|nr:hypothetical protein [Cellulosimicrobium cellulans]MBM7820119.1 hypothetical protein [Cellulosimicrobium cellulans]
MERKHWVIGSLVVVIVAVAAYIMGWVSGPDSPAHVVPRSHEEWTAAAAWVAVFVAVAAAVFAGVQALEARRIRIDQAQPHVVAYLEQDPDIPSAVNIVIANFGATAARDVAVTADGPIRGTLGLGGGPGVKAVPLPKEFSTLAPGQKWRTFWDWAPDRSTHPELENEKRVTLTFTYGGVAGSKPREESTLDWSVIDARTYGSKKTMHHAAIALEAIAAGPSSAQSEMGEHQPAVPGVTVPDSAARAGRRCLRATWRGLIGR